MAHYDLSSPMALGYKSMGHLTAGIVHVRVDASEQNFGAGDVVYILKVPAGTLVEDVCWRAATGQTGAIDLGDYSDIVGTAIDADGYLDASVVTTTGNVGNVMDSPTAGAYLGGRFYGSAAYIAINNATHTLTTAVIDFWFVVRRVY